MAKLYYRYAAMNAGKSTAVAQVAFNYSERDQRAVVIKSVVDTKSKDKAVSRTGLSVAVDILSNKRTNLYKAVSKLHEEDKVSCVIVDEAQFLTPRQVEHLHALASILNIPVIAYGLRTTSSTKSFGGAKRLFELADSIEEMKTICRCGSKAVFNARKVDGEFIQGGPEVAIDGEGVEYESMCKKCFYDKVGVPWDPRKK